MKKKPPLTAKQLKAISALLDESSITKAAKAAGISRTSIHSWMNQPEFKEELDRRNYELFKEGLNILKKSTKKAALKLIELLDGKNINHARFASKEILNFAIKAAELQEIEQRLERLEDKLI